MPDRIITTNGGKTVTVTHLRHGDTHVTVHDHHYQLLTSFGLSPDRAADFARALESPELPTPSQQRLASKNIMTVWNLNRDANLWGGWSDPYSALTDGSGYTSACEQAAHHWNLPNGEYRFAVMNFERRLKVVAVTVDNRPVVTATNVAV